MKISLTLDNGPTPEVTPYVLDMLGATGVAATFFLLGQNLCSEQGKQLAKRTRKEGHNVGNHTYTHRMFGTLESPAEAIAEIEKTETLLGDLTGSDKLFRPAGGGGQLNPNVMTRRAFNHLRENNHSCVLWNSVPRDWEDPDGWVDRALSDIRKLEWTVLVLHDLPTGAMRNLEPFIRQAQDLGAEFTQAFPQNCTPLWRGSVLWDPEMVER